MVHADKAWALGKSTHSGSVCVVEKGDGLRLLRKSQNLGFSRILPIF